MTTLDTYSLSDLLKTFCLLIPALLATLGPTLSYLILVYRLESVPLAVEFTKKKVGNRKFIITIAQ